MLLAIDGRVAKLEESMGDVKENLKVVEDCIAKSDYRGDELKE